ncbi:hypothetical protein AGMMS49546_18210 [Spirochaetia bacterium]|nr:hypothetical protein AGMMS49546_18210 [Spirochaetia bacterium]
MKYKEQEINTYLLENNLSSIPLFTRMGINTGDMVVGNMGSERKMNYTIMGNAVNLAARLEGVNKHFKSRILITGETLKAAGDTLITRRLRKVRVVGINMPVQAYELLDIKGKAADKTLEIVELFNRAREIFENRDWAGAEAAFEAVLKLDADDGPAQTFRDWSAEFRRTPPAADWDGMLTLSEK